MDPLTSRRNEERERRRADILDAAHRVAAGVGFDALTMDQVARAARLSRGLLYVYFEDRGDLHLGLCERALSLFHSRAAAAAGREANGLDRLLSIGRAYVAFADEAPVYFEALARFQAGAGAASQAEGNLPACLAASDRVFDLIIGLINDGIEDGSVSPSIGEVRSVAISLWALMHGAIQIARLKVGVLETQGVTPAGLMEQALGITRVALSRSEPAGAES
ncbi:MAG: TetR/AcrR family transcriptional regulator [Gammaproteobacteria bacterium]|nr:TetR/AcrR family transcriptional regulator [Gammaproteobacteria bacterium]